MGVNNFRDFENDGEIINPDSVNQYREALTGDIVPRGGDGRPYSKNKSIQNRPSVGTNEYPFKEGHFSSLKVSDHSIRPSVLNRDAVLGVISATFERVLNFKPFASDSRSFTAFRLKLLQKSSSNALQVLIDGSTEPITVATHDGIIDITERLTLSLVGLDFGSYVSPGDDDIYPVLGTFLHPSPWGSFSLSRSGVPAAAPSLSGKLCGVETNQFHEINLMRVAGGLVSRANELKDVEIKRNEFFNVSSATLMRRRGNFTGLEAGQLYRYAAIFYNYETNKLEAQYDYDPFSSTQSNYRVQPHTGRVYRAGQTTPPPVILLGHVIVSPTQIVGIKNEDLIRDYSPETPSSILGASPDNFELTDQQDRPFSVYGEDVTSPNSFLANNEAGRAGATLPVNHLETEKAYYVYVNFVTRESLDNPIYFFDSRPPERDRFFKLKGWYHPEVIARCIGVFSYDFVRDAGNDITKNELDLEAWKHIGSRIFLNDVTINKRPTSRLLAYKTKKASVDTNLKASNYGIVLDNPNVYTLDEASSQVLLNNSNQFKFPPLIRLLLSPFCINVLKMSAANARLVNFFLAIGVNSRVIGTNGTTVTSNVDVGRLFFEIENIYSNNIIDGDTTINERIDWNILGGLNGPDDQSKILHALTRPFLSPHRQTELNQGGAKVNKANYDGFETDRREDGNWARPHIRLDFDLELLSLSRTRDEEKLVTSRNGPSLIDYWNSL